MKQELLGRARILLVDDEPQNVRYLEDVLRWAGYERIESTTDSKQAVPTFLRFQPDLVILDLLMPDMDGFAVLEGIREHLEEDDYLPILILTSDVSREARRRALGAGARDFLTKPMSPTEVGIRVSNLLEARFLHLRCLQLEQRLNGEGNGEEMEKALDEALEGWAAAADAGASEPGAHARRVAEAAAGIARALGLPSTRVRRLARATLLHDAPADSLADHDSGLLQTAHAIAAGHALPWNGGEDPVAKRGEEIPLEARIVAVAHRFDRLLQGSSPASVARAIERIEGEAGSRFDPEVVKALASCHMAETA